MEACLGHTLIANSGTVPELSADARAILESMGDAFYALDGAWRVVYVNRRALAFWGLGAGGVLGHVLWDCLPQMVGTRNETLLRRARTEQREIDYEAMSVVTGAWIHVTAMPAGDGVHVYFRDITPRVRTERTLRANEEHLRLAQEAAGIGMWEWDLATGHLHWSPQVFQLLGRDPAEAQAPDHRDLWGRVVHPDDRRAVAKAIRETSHNQGPFALEFRIVRGDGEIRWIDARGSVVPDAYGNPRRMIGVNIDVTERKQTEAALEQRVAERTRALQDTVEALRNSRELYAALFAHAPIYIAFVRLEADGRLLVEDVNDSWLRDSGFRREQVIGRALDQIFRADQAAFGEAQYRKAIETGEPVEYEYTDVFPAGEVTRRSFLVPLHDKTGRVNRVLLTSMDLTAMRRMEAQLRQAQKMEAIGQLTGGIAHDFNNLLTIVLGNLELLQSRLQDERSMRHLRAAQRAGERGGELTHQLLAYARRQPISPRAVDLVALIGGMGDLLQRSLGGLVRVKFALAAELWPAFCDPTQLELMLLNLAINARDAMPGGGTIGIQARNAGGAEKLPAELAAGDYVAISVVDSGTGMPPDVRERAFEPFFTTKEPGKGSGLGLAQVWGLAQQFGGTVLLDSAPAHGTTVCVYLPRSAAAAAAGPAPPPSGAGDTAGGRTILVVDDDADARDVAVAFLEQEGYVARVASNGEEALACLEQMEVALALVDYAMPGMPGTEFAQRARVQCGGLQVVFVTGNPDALADRIGGGGAVVAKPYTRAGLAEAVRRALRL